MALRYAARFRLAFFCSRECTVELVLAGGYGLIFKELDASIGYDIKYDMGRQG